MNERIKLLVEQDGFQCIKDKALRLALGALQRFIKYDYNENPFDGKDVEGADAITAIKEALAQPEQNPVAWGFQNTAITGSNRWMMLREEVPADDQYNGALWTPLYTTPPQRTWVGLTDEDLIECERLADIRHRRHMMSIRGQQLSPADQFLWHYARAIEAKLKDKGNRVPKFNPDNHEDAPV